MKYLQMIIVYKDLLEVLGKYLLLSKTPVGLNQVLTLVRLVHQQSQRIHYKLQIGMN